MTPTTGLPTNEPLPRATLLPTVAPASADEVALQVAGQIGGTSRALALAGDVAYVGVGGRLAAVDAADPTTPTIVAYSPVLGTTVEAVVVQGNLAYIAANEGGLWLLDVHDPTQLRVLGSLKTPGQAEGVAVRASLAFVAAGDAGLQVVDVQDPAAPRLIGGLDTPADARCIELAGDTALIADADQRQQDGGLRIVDVSRPAEPRLLISLPMGDAQAVAVAGDRAYVAAYSSAAAGRYSVCVLDISHPDHPEQVTELMPPVFSTITDVGVASGRPYLSGGFIDLADPNAPLTPLPAEPLATGESSPGRGMAIASGHFYQASVAGLEMWDMTPTGWSRVGGTASLGSVDSVLVRGSTAYVITNSTTGASCLILDVRQPEQPVLLASLPLPRYCQECESVPGQPALGDGYLMVPMWQDGILLIDVRDPARPSVYAHLETAKTAGMNQVATLAPDVYLLTGAGEPRLLDARSHNQPRFAALPFAVTPGEIPLDAVAVAGQPLALVLATADMATWSADAVCVLDVGDPLHPQQLGRIEVPGAEYLAVADGFAYVSTWDSDCQARLQVLDIRDPQQPVRVGTWIGTSGCFPYYRESYSVAAADGYVYFAEHILDVSDPRAPREVGHTEVPQARQQAAGEWVYDAHRDGGLRILHRVSSITRTSER